jgi:hypothetical protein
MLIRGDHRQHVVLRHDLAILIGDFGVPANFAVSRSRPQGFLFAAKADLQGVAIIDGLGKAQFVNAVIGENRTEVGIDKQAGGKGKDKVTMGNATIEEWIPGRSLFVGMRVKLVASKLGEMLYVFERNFSRGCNQGIAKLQLFEGFSKRVYARVVLIGTLDPAVTNRCKRFRRSLHCRSLHVVQYAADAAHFLTTACAPGTAMNEMREGGAVSG